MAGDKVRGGCDHMGVHFRQILVALESLAGSGNSKEFAVTRVKGELCEDICLGGKDGGRGDT